MRRAMMTAVLLGCVLGGAGCITRAEYAANVRAWRSYYDTTRDDLVTKYDVLPEPIRTNRLGLVEEEGRTIAAAEERAGIAPEGSK